MNTDIIYVIMWRGRDADSEVFDDYPCNSYGWFDDEKTAQRFCDTLNGMHEHTDPETGIKEVYFVMPVQRATTASCNEMIEGHKRFYGIK